MPIWSDSYLNQLAVDAEQQINKDLPVLFKRFNLAINKDQSVYTLPDYVRGIRKITYRGRELDAASWEELTLLTPATAVQSQSGVGWPVPAGSTVSIEAGDGRCFWYALHPTSIFDIRLYPPPSETFDSTGDPYSPDSGPHLTVSCWRAIDSTFSDNTALLPNYIDRRTRKAYVLWKAFETEGIGQNLTAAAYYKSKYNFLIKKFTDINEGCFIAKKYALDDGQLATDRFRYPRPLLPPQFERVIY